MSTDPIAAALADRPEPSPAAVAAARGGVVSSAVAAEAELIREEFDPLEHEVDAEGRPILNVDGSLRKIPGRKPKNKKRRRRRRGAVVIPPPVVAPPTPAVRSPAGDGPEVPADPSEGTFGFTESAELSVDTVEEIGCTLVGELGETQPRTRKRLRRAFDRYYRANGAPDLPPGWALVVALGFYVKDIALPIYQAHKAAKAAEAEAAADASRSDRGNDPQRQDLAGG